jgi:hypothetical protein
MELRRSGSMSFEGIRRLGVVLKRARYFITLGGTFLDAVSFANTAHSNTAFGSVTSSSGLRRALDNPKRLRRILADEDDGLQLPLFDF